MSNKLAVIFPGVGYHSDKPLLYYSRKLAMAKDYEIIEVTYNLTHKAGGIKTDSKQALDATEEAFEQAHQQLKAINFSDYDKIVFIGKSIGTAVAAKYNMTYRLDADMVIFTPIETTFSYLGPCEGFVFHGDADPFCDTDMCVQLCEEMSLTYAVIPNANHSLETGEVGVDIQNLKQIMSIVEKLI